MRNSLVVAVLASLLVAGSAVAAPCALKLGWESYAPYQMKVGDDVGGFEVEMFAVAAKEAGCTFSAKEVPWKRLMVDLEAGRMDAAMGVTRTPEREAYLSFTDTYRNDEMVLFVRKNEAGKYPLSGADDVVKTKLKLGVVGGYEYGEALEKIKVAAPAQIDESSGTDLNIRKLLAGRVDGFLEAREVGVQTIKDAGVVDKIEVHPFVFSSGPVHFAFSKKSVDPETAGRFDAALVRLKADGRFQAIVDKYSK